MSKLNKEQVKYIAELARLELSDEEIEKYTDQLSQVLSYIEELKEVDVEGVEPTSQVSGLKNILREDVVKDWDESEREVALKQAPQRQGRFIKVKRILE